MYVVTTTDGREYRYDSYEAAFLATRTLFGWNGYTIEDEDGEMSVVCKVRDKERKI